LNIHFLSSLLFIAAFAFINYINTRPQYISLAQSDKGIFSKFRFLDFVIPAILLIALYCAFRIEIDTYWQQLYKDSALTLSTGDYPKSLRDNSLLSFGNVWGLIYTLVFLAILTFVNSKKIKSKGLGLVSLGLNLLCLLVFLSHGLEELETLKYIYQEQTSAEYYSRTPFYIGIRYVVFAAVGLLLLASYEYLQSNNVGEDYEIPFDAVLHFTILATASYELMYWLGIANANQSDKLGLSIFWGVYALFLIVLGLWKKKKHLRIGGMVLFTITLVKLFFYDLADLDTISKTIVLVSLGVLLLIISFLYNKYKERV